MTALLALLLCSTWPLAGDGDGTDKVGVKNFAPGIRIDWTRLTVELESEIALREGPLEFLACSPRTKEHESILVVLARPSQIFQAMGLVGLTPGSPTRYIEKEDRWEPARGEGLELRIRVTEGDRVRLVKPEEWVLRSEGDKTTASPELRWVFAGSLTARDGRFAADLEGTVAGLVDFESNLIALNASHSADNEQLWLIANKERIPPRGTRCQLFIRSDHRPATRVVLAADGSIRGNGRVIEPSELAQLLKPLVDDPRAAELEICPEASVPEGTREHLLKALKKAGFEGNTKLLDPPCREKGDSPNGN